MDCAFKIIVNTNVYVCCIRKCLRIPYPLVVIEIKLWICAFKITVNTNVYVCCLRKGLLLLKSGNLLK